jgi:hypothetical protein
MKPTSFPSNPSAPLGIQPTCLLFKRADLSIVTDSMSDEGVTQKKRNSSNVKLTAVTAVEY